jgi:hypothetical protein
MYKLVRQWRYNTDRKKKKGSKKMYDYFEELHRVQDERYSCKGEMKSGSWQIESWGSASCASSTMGSIYAAYEESRICDEW